MNAFTKSGELFRKRKHLDSPDTTVADLGLMLRLCTEAIANPEKAIYRDKNLAFREAVNAEIARRRKRVSDAA
jgi:hypothetical protein